MLLDQRRKRDEFEEEDQVQLFGFTLAQDTGFRLVVKSYRGDQKANADSLSSAGHGEKKFE